MDSESPSDDSISPDLRRFRAFARTLFTPAVVLATLGSLGSLAAAGLGQFECAERAFGPDYRARDLVVVPLVCLFLVGMVRQAGHASGEMLRRANEAFELYSIPLIEVSSIRITFSMFVFAITVLGVLVMLCIPIGIAFASLKSIWITCVMAADSR